MHRILTLFLLLMLSAQSFASAVQHDCGEMGGAGSMSHADMDMHHEMPGDMPCCDDVDNSVAASEQASQCQLSCALGACASPVAVLAVFQPFDVAAYHPTVLFSAIDRPDSPLSSLFRPPIAA
ncbi:hypothetical protein AUP74_00860 [Microbulbifer aggregans]|uniref:Uncharacterized protein n=1 Tax=Microbulbifer aggregans TaxID=1769779 RepID=A0A1C9W5B8_9GAMM|nr:hypothetical protein [Microbulbifer aggregans]AOS96327.1 hypothetical protein AUP74_00860 [Microbulbifer aggregans]